ncbi:isovaleryl CoA dehydrogenase [compost metagenome]
MALDVLRALQREPDALPALEQEFAHAAGQYQAFDAALVAWRALLAESAQAEFQARRIACGLARLWQAALLIQHAPAAVAQAFVASRLHADGGVFGELAAGAESGAILARAWPSAAAC